MTAPPARPRAYVTLDARAAAGQGAEPPPARFWGRMPFLGRAALTPLTHLITLQILFSTCKMGRATLSFSPRWELQYIRDWEALNTM